MYRLSIASTLLLSLFFTACNEYLPSEALTSAQAEALERTAEYSREFQASFGAVSPFHTWGLEPMQAMGGEKSSSTRSGADPSAVCRIMCEDLAAFDHDFNDLVFDLSFFDDDNDGNASAIITLQAAGGTLPIYIGNAEHEAHSLFGAEVTTPVNVIQNGTSVPPVTFVYPGQIARCNAETPYLFDPNSIDIAVSTTGNKVQLLKTEVGGAPQKFACANNVPWTSELTDIRTAYPGFSDWVSNPQSTTWYNVDVNAENNYLLNTNTTIPIVTVEDVVVDDSEK